MTSKNIFSCIFFTILFGLTLYISGVLGVLELAFSLLFYLLVFYGFYFLWKKLRRKTFLSFIDFIPLFAIRLASFLTTFFLVFGAFCIYANEISPAKMPRFTLSNGVKTVEFQAMVHIARSDFYNAVEDFIRLRKQENYVLFFEGVRPGTAENTKKFDTALGMKFDKDLYKNFSKLYGVTFQDNEQFLGLVNDLDFNVDLSIDEIMELYSGENSLPKKVPNEVLDANDIILDQLSLLNERQLKILVYVNQAILNTLIKSEGVQDFMLDKIGNKALFDIILNKRNELIAEAIKDSKYDKIIVTYGLLHFRGVFEMLQESDPNWKIIKVTEYYPITSGSLKSFLSSL